MSTSALPQNELFMEADNNQGGHPAPFPIELAERLIRMFSFAGDTVLDPFVGTGTTSVAALRAGRCSIGNEIDPAYLKLAAARMTAAGAQRRLFGATQAEVMVD